MALPARVTFILGIMVLLASAAGSHSASAQLYQGAGIHAGGVASTADTSADGLQLDTKYGWSMSAFVEWIDHDVLSVITEAGYVQRGFQEEYAFIDIEAEEFFTVQTSTRVGYLSVPLLLKLSPGVGVISPYLLTGVRVEFLLHREAGVIEARGSVGESEVANLYDDSSMGATFGAGVSTDHFGDYRLFVEARYDTDLTDSTSSVPVEFLNTAYRLVLGIRL